ncbi:MAG: ubiquitin carboxyl-terminal hydrolase [Deltaproteobacteria bacterium]|nr:ubiquitin carboxyl-terminal hydrolase [Deltaproteobacteria bacterium]
MLQLIISSKYIIKSILDDEEEQNNLLKEFQIFLRNYTSNNLSQNDSVKLLRIFLLEVKEKHPSSVLNSLAQQSASEGMTFFLDMLNSKHLNKILTHVTKESIVCKQTKEIISSKKNINNQFMLFDTNDLIKRGLPDALLCSQDNLEEDFIPEDHTKDANKQYKRVYILKYIPEVIIISLNKYIQKNNVVLPDSFKIPHINGSDMVYIKKAEVDHLGSLGGGHYIGRALREDKVFLFNDVNYSESQLKTNKNTYITLYELK